MKVLGGYDYPSLFYSPTAIRNGMPLVACMVVEKFVSGEGMRGCRACACVCACVCARACVRRKIRTRINRGRQQRDEREKKEITEDQIKSARKSGAGGGD